jgi:hypothetical protein
MGLDSEGTMLMRKIIISSFVVFSFIICASAQQPGAQSQSDSVKVVQTSDKNTLNKKTITNPKPPTNWSRIKELFK